MQRAELAWLFRVSRGLGGVEGIRVPGMLGFLLRTRGLGFRFYRGLGIGVGNRGCWGFSTDGPPPGMNAPDLASWDLPWTKPYEPPW